MDKKENELSLLSSSGSKSKAGRFLIAAISGFIPFAGGAVGGIANYLSENEQDKINETFTTWLRIHEERIIEISDVLSQIYESLETNSKSVKYRIESPEYLSLVNKSFKDWSSFENSSKKKYIKNLLTNAVNYNLSTDEILRLFITWIENYSEIHFRVLFEIHKNRELTKYNLWHKIHGAKVSEDSVEADLFRLFIQDLNFGKLIRQKKYTDSSGNFKSLKKKSPKLKYGIKSSFNNIDLYTLTKLGERFIYYINSSTEDFKKQ